MSYLKGPDIEKALPDYRPHTSVLTLLVNALRRNGQDTAVVEGETGKSVSFAGLLQNCGSIASGLRSVGVGEGDVVMLCCEKSILAYSLLLGSIFTGATCVLAPPPNVDILDQLTGGRVVKAVFYDQVYQDSVTRSVSRMIPTPSIVAVTDLQDPVMASLLKSTEEFSVHEVKDNRKHIPLVFFSSGTTGQPKGIELTDVSVQLSGVHFGRRLNPLIVSSPLYWYSGMFTLISSILFNYSLIVSNSKQPKDRLQLIQKHRVQTLFASIANMIQYINEPDLNSYDLSSISQVVVGGEIVLGSVAKEFVTKVLGGRIQPEVAYGTTEGGFLASLTPEDQKGRGIQVGACGKLFPGVQIKLLDDNGKVVPIGTQGEIWVNSGARTTGYWDKPELNHGMFDKDGFYQSGDVGFFDKDGHLYLRGRICDLVNFRGVKNSPAEVEDVLMSHPDVMDAAVIGRDHPTDIQHMTAYVVVRPGSSVTEEQVRHYVDGRVEDNLKLRGGVYFRESLPRVSSGKVIRKFV